MIKQLLVKASFLFILFHEQTIAQNEINIEGSQVISNFKFVDSSGDIDKSYLNVMSGAYGISYLKTTKKNLLLKVGAGMRKGGASLAYGNNTYSWQLQYIDAKIGVGYIISKWRLRPYVMLTPYYSFLMKANQTVNTQNYDMMKSKSIKNSDYGINGAFGIKVPLSDLLAIYAEGSYLYGLQNNEPTTSQKLYNRAYFLTFGISGKISKLSPKWIQEGK